MLDDTSELLQYIEDEGRSILIKQSEITDQGALLGYHCLIRLEVDTFSVTGAADLYTIEQAKVIVHEVLRQQVRFMAAKIQSQKRAKTQRRKKEDAWEDQG